MIIFETLNLTFSQSPLLSLNSDQFSRLITGKSKIPYSDSTILKGYQLQSVSGKSGYNLLRSDIPNCFPAVRTIRRSLSSFAIFPGAQKHVIELLSNKLSNYPLYNRKIVLSFDEFSISPKIEYSQQHRIFVGLPTLKPVYANAQVKNCLIFIAQCLTLPIRVPVSVDFTTSSTSPGILEIILNYYLLI